MKIQKNHHTHTHRCKHATQDVSHYCAAAIEQGLTVLGISDHTALPDNRRSHIRMGIEELPGYIRAVDEAIESFPDLTILKAALQSYADYFIKSMESGLFAFMAHPDLFGNSYLTWDDNSIQVSRDMLTAAAELQVPLEINGYGLRKPKIDTPSGTRCMYPWLPFWELASEYDVRVIVNSDAHRP